jgi:hypothetical protein
MVAVVFDGTFAMEMEDSSGDWIKLANVTNITHSPMVVGIDTGHSGPDFSSHVPIDKDAPRNRHERRRQRALQRAKR